MSKNIRIRTNLNDVDEKHIKIQLNQDFDFLEVLSLKISQEDVYRNFYSDYGVIVGRVIMNSGVGVPNAKISVFIPLSEEDSENPKISSLYPYKDLQDLNSEGIRYNTLPKNSQGECHTPIGTFPTKRELIDNENLFEVFQKYYKYTTTTNSAGDFMLFGVPVGNHILNVDVDLSDIGIFSQKPYDFIEQGNPSKLFDSPTKFKKNTNLNNLTQVKNRQVGVNVIPFWGENEGNEVGISRLDIDLNYNVAPKAIFMGSIFGENEASSLNKNCRPNRKMGAICEMTEGEGTIQMLRKNIYGGNERFDINGGRVIDDKGAWAYQIPMNLDYMITDEFGDLRLTEDTTRGIPTRARVRFKINLDQTGGEGRLRSRANYLIPHNPNNLNEVDYTFNDSTSDLHFKDFYWNKIYTIKNHIGRFQKNDNPENRNFIGLKDVDDCVGNKTPIPFNKLDTKFNPLYTLLCIIITFIVAAIALINSVIRVKIPIIGRIFGCHRCIDLDCDGVTHKPGCSGCELSNKEALEECLQITLAISLNVFKFDFYNDWLNGTLYAFLFKYKKPKFSDAKYCGNGNGDDGNYIINTNPENGKSEEGQWVKLQDGEGVIASFEGELFYKPITNDGYKLYSTDTYNLGSVFSCDWQGIPKIQSELFTTTYQLPPLTSDYDGVNENDVTPLEPLLLGLNCFNAKTNFTQSRNIRRLCEIGVGLDEYRVVNEVDDESNFIDDIPEDGRITNKDIDNSLIRDNLIKLNNDFLSDKSVNDINSNFNGPEYSSYRRKVIKGGSFEQYNDSFYFYFGSHPNNSAINLMNSKFFTECSREKNNGIIILSKITNEKTLGGGDGKIEIDIIGGSPIFTYKWYKLNADGKRELIYEGVDVSEGQTRKDLSGGTYFVEVKDGIGLTSKKTFIIDEVKILMVDIEHRNAFDISSNNGTLIINTITGGIKPYDVEITGPLTDVLMFKDIFHNLTVNDLGVGAYTVKITDKSEIPQSFEEVITIKVPEPIFVNVESFDPKCINTSDGEIKVTIEGGVPNYEVELIEVRSDNSKVNHFPDVQTTSKFEFIDLSHGIYELSIKDNFDVPFNETIILNEIKELLIDRIWFSITNSSTYVVANTIDGVTYKLIDDDENVLETWVSDGNNYQGEISGNMIGYKVESEFGCYSNAIKE